VATAILFDATSEQTGLAVEKSDWRDPMKFRNGDINLDDAIKHNGGHLAGMANLDALLDAKW